MKRRDFLRASAAGVGKLAVASAAYAGGQQVFLVRDLHTGIESAIVSACVRPKTVDEIRSFLRHAQRPVCLGGALHSGGAQQFVEDGWMLDLSGLSDITKLDGDGDFVDVQPGVQWPQLVEFLRKDAPQRTIRQKQSISTVTIGGSVSANAHGNRLGMPPIVGDVKHIDIMDGAGKIRRCSRDENADWFRMAVGGYGAVGVITSVRLSLCKRVPVRPLLEFVQVPQMAEAFAHLREGGSTHGLCVLHPSLRNGALWHWVPDESGKPQPATLESDSDFRRMMSLLHRDAPQAYREICAAWLDMSGRTWWPDDLLLSESYVAGYHAALDPGPQRPGCDPIAEFLVPPSEMAGFLEQVRKRVQTHHLQVLQASIRQLAADTETVLSYAPHESLSVALMFHVERSKEPLANLTLALRNMLDDAMARGGRFHPAFGRFATRDQMRACFSMDEFVAAKLRMDPDGKFSSRWYQFYCGQ